MGRPVKLEGPIRSASGTRTASAEAATYEAAKAALEQQVGEGEQLLSIRRLDG